MFRKRVDHLYATGVNVEAELVHTPRRGWDDFFLREDGGDNSLLWVAVEEVAEVGALLNGKMDACHIFCHQVVVHESGVMRRCGGIRGCTWVE